MTDMDTGTNTQVVMSLLVQLLVSYLLQHVFGQVLLFIHGQDGVADLFIGQLQSVTDIQTHVSHQVRQPVRVRPEV